MRRFSLSGADLSIEVDDRRCADARCVREDPLLERRVAADLEDRFDDVLRVLEALCEERALLDLSLLEHRAKIPRHVPDGDALDPRLSALFGRLERLRMARSVERPAH